MDRDAAGIDLVIGAKGSPLQLILSTVFHIDIPTGNISVADAGQVIAEPVVKRAIPLALGDSYKTFRIVGTNPAYIDLYSASLNTGRLWNAPQEAVVGAEVARITGLRPAAMFAGSHGLTEGGGGHADHPYTVVGVLKPTGSVIDRLIITSVESVWRVHEHAQSTVAPSKDHDHADHEDGKEVTAYLIQYATPLAAASFPRIVNANSGLQAASPAMETARLFNLLGFGVAAMKAFALIMMLCAAMGIFVGLMNALDETQRKQAVLNYRVADLVLGPGQDGKTIQPEGLKGSAMNDKQRAMLLDLISEWSGIVHETAAAARLAELKADLNETWLAWSGPTTVEAGKNGTAYYRIQGPKLVIEYSPQQMGGDPANHIHSMYRDPTNDYGRKPAAK